MGRPAKEMDGEEEAEEVVERYGDAAEEWEEWPEDMDYSDESFVDSPTKDPRKADLATTPKETQNASSLIPAGTSNESLKPLTETEEGLKELDILMEKEQVEKVRPSKRIRLEKASPTSSEDLDTASTDYFYYCLDCEALHNDPNDPLKTRFPITIDMAGHIASTNHQKFAPIKTTMGVRMSNVSLKVEHNKTVIKKWRRLVKDGDIPAVRYTLPRKCKKCDEVLEDSVDMFKHIKEAHIDPLLIATFKIEES